MLGTVSGLVRVRGRFLLVAAVVVGAMALLAGRASAATPALGIKMTHLNAFGAEAGLCPTGKAEPVATEPCGVDPFTEKEAGDAGETFARESADNIYTITVTNTGEAPTNAPVTVVDELPQGMLLGGLIPERLFETTGWKCKAEPGAGGVNAGAVTCKSSKTVAALASYPPITLPVSLPGARHAGKEVQPVSPSINKATASGGGAVASASTTPQEGETLVTPEVPFGIAKSKVDLFNEPSEPEPVRATIAPIAPVNQSEGKGWTIEALTEAFSQAAGHPFAVTTELEFNYTPDYQGQGVGGTQRLVTAGGGEKEAQVELPPGFVGDPQNAPVCPLVSLKNNQCPRNTAVGYAQVSLSGKIENGKAHIFETPGKAKNGHDISLVYNLQPTPGHPAEFGFLIAEGVPFVLEAKVRTGGDYGVTVGDSAIGEKPLATKVTFCANGASGETKFFQGKAGHLVEEHGFFGVEEIFPSLYCKKAEGASRPFLTNLAECSASAPIWSVLADPWDEPNAYVKATVSQNPAVTGCQLLQFHPEVEVKPTPASEGGTTQADEPTGVAVNLTVPQTNEKAVNATPEVRDVKTTLPAGMTASPSAADGLQACSDAQFWPSAKDESEEAEGKVPGEVEQQREPAVTGKCKPASKIGTVEVFTPLLSGAPSIEGLPKPGEALECSPGMWSGSPTLSYQWLRNGVPIPDATRAEYAPESKKGEPGEGKDEKMPLQCQVTAENEGGSSVAVSRATVVIPPSEREPGAVALAPPPPPVPPSSIAAPSGTATIGNALTCTSDAWTDEPKPAATAEEPKPPPPPITLSYQWLRNGAAVAGATGVSYTLGPEDAGKVIQCQVTGTNEGGPVIADSAAVVASPLPAPAPPLPGAAVQGEVFVGEPECSPCTEANHDAVDGRIFRLFLQVQDAKAGVVIKLHGTTSANEETGQLTTTFVEQPQQPFELLQLKLKGGPRAPLANPQTCGPAVATADLTPWSTPATPDALIESPPFNVEGCPAAMPFGPSFNAGTIGPNATAADMSPSFSLTFAREDREQDLSGLTVHMPLGLVGKIPAVKECGEAELAAAKENRGECPAASEIGTATTLAGPGSDPFADEGHVYFTGPYKGAPFGIAVVTLAKSGPFNLGNVVVRSTINIDPNTAAVTVTSDPLPQIVSGVPIRLRRVNVNVTKPGFMLNPTNCNAQAVAATLGGLQGASAQVSSPFGITGCKNLPFHPTFTATTQANTSKTNGASLDVKLTYPPGLYANIAKSVVELPTALPSRLTTLQKACPDAVFNANPATCPEGSVVGQAIAHTPVLNQPLTGPAYLVSHGGAKYPDLEIILQGEGVKVILDGQTNIEKGITKTTFESLPDSPVETFELNLPEGPHSVLGANGNLCEEVLNAPTVLTGQNGIVMKQSTKIGVTGCPVTFAVTKTKISGNALLVTVKTSNNGTVKISGKGLKTITKKNLAAGSHQIRVTLTKAGRSMRKHKKKVSVHVSLTVGKQAVAKATTVRL